MVVNVLGFFKRKQKGQGIVEYALILAFVVGIAMMMNGTNLGSTIRGVFDDVAVEFGYVHDYASAVKNWGKKSNQELSNENKEKRLGIDEEALANLATYFIGKDRAFMQNLLKNNNLAKSNQVLVLGWFYENDQGGTSFDFSDEHFKTLQKEQIEQGVFSWLQGDYGEGGYTTSYNPDTKYFFSEYALDTNKDSISSENYRKGGVKVKLNYDSDGIVVGAKVVVDSKNQGSAPSSTKSKGLEVTVTKGNNGNTVGLTNGFKDF